MMFEIGIAATGRTACRGDLQLVMRSVVGFYECDYL